MTLGKIKHSNSQVSLSFLKYPSIFMHAIALQQTISKQLFLLIDIKTMHMLQAKALFEGLIS